MRCLYCGKELALLKRWTGGGEFCSDVHRQRYQEEYNQLALNRLLQAKPPAKPEKTEPEKSVAEKPINEVTPARPVPVAEVTKVESASPATPHATPRSGRPPAGALRH